MTGVTQAMTNGICPVAKFDEEQRCRTSTSTGKSVTRVYCPNSAFYITFGRIGRED